MPTPEPVEQTAQPGPAVDAIAMPSTAPLEHAAYPAWIIGPTVPGAEATCPADRVHAPEFWAKVLAAPEVESSGWHARLVANAEFCTVWSRMKPRDWWNGAQTGETGKLAANAREFFSSVDEFSAHDPALRDRDRYLAAVMDWVVAGGPVGLKALLRDHPESAYTTDALIWVGDWENHQCGS